MLACVECDPVWLYVYSIWGSSISSFHISQDADVSLPKPGGKVWIRKRLCRFANSEVKVKMILIFGLQ